VRQRNAVAAPAVVAFLLLAGATVLAFSARGSMAGRRRAPGSVEAARYQAEQSWLRHSPFSTTQRNDLSFFLVENDHNGSFEYQRDPSERGPGRGVSILNV